jgi:Protein of unknown function (DUF3768)
MDSKTARIRALNDELRQNFAGAAAVMTPGIAALGAEAVARIFKTVAVFDDFCHANDPHQEHDFGAFDADGQRVFFKSDYYDESLSYHSPDPADPSVTKRVIRSCWPKSTDRSRRSSAAAAGCTRNMTPIADLRRCGSLQRPNRRPA